VPAALVVLQTLEEEAALGAIKNQQLRYRQGLRIQLL
jgi:hypothetical protein